MTDSASCSWGETTTGRPAFMTPCLFPGNCCQGSAQVIAMVAGDGGNDRKDAGKSVGGIEPPSHPHFHHRQTYLLFCEVKGGHGRNQLEKCGFRWSCGDDLLSQVNHFLFGYLTAVDADPFGKIYQVRRSE